MTAPEPAFPTTLPTLLSERDQSLVFAQVVLKWNDAILVTDADIDHPDGPVIELLNPAALEPRSLTAEGLVGQRLNALLFPAVLGRVIDHLREARERRLPVVREGPSTRRSGKTVWLTLQALPIFGDEGAIGHFIYETRDITERHQAEQEREATLRLLASVFGAIEMPLGVVDEGWRFGFVNAALGQQLGWGRMDLLGQPLAKVIGPIDRERVQQALAAVTQAGQKVELETALERANGVEVPGQLRATLIIQPDGRHYRVVTLGPRLAGMGQVDNDLEAALRKALGREGSAFIVAGRLQMVGLHEVRAALGERWEAVAERAYGIAERILKRHLGPEDVFSRTADDSFLVFFADLPESEAHFKSLAIGQEIRERLVGEIPEIARPQVKSVVAQVPRATLTTAKGRLEDIITAALNQRMLAEQQRVLHAALETVKDGLTTAQIAFSAARTATGHPAPILLAHPPRELAAALATLHELGYVDYAVEAEMALLTGAVGRILAELGQERSDLIVVELRMATLVHRRDADRWLALARGMGAPAKRRLAVELREIDRDIPASRLAQLLALLTPLFRLVACELPTADPGFLRALPPQLSIATIAAARLGGREEEMATTAGRIVRALAPRNCRLIVKQVRSAEQAAALARAGVSLTLPALD